MIREESRVLVNKVERGTVFAIEDGWAAVTLDALAHKSNPSVFWAKLEELEEVRS